MTNLTIGHICLNRLTDELVIIRKDDFDKSIDELIWVELPAHHQFKHIDVPRRF